MFTTLGLYPQVSKMMTSISKVELAKEFPGMASRAMGTLALDQVVHTLRECEVVELDFGGGNPSPSFADQFVGGLAERLGLPEFKRRVRIRNASADILPLLRHVILRKAGRQN